MMSRPLLLVCLFLGSLLLLTPQPTTGFAVKLRGDNNDFGEGDASNMEEKEKVKIPMGDDGIPAPNAIVNSRTDIDLDEENIENSAFDNFLIKYGYLKRPANGLVTEDERREAVKKFQKFAHLSVTGIVDEKTKVKMFMPRCGLSDPVENSKLANFETATKWSKKDLTYQLIKYSQKVSPQVASDTLDKALKMWEKASGLTFKKVDTKSFDLNISFVTRDHQDGSPFDGSGGVLGHAFYPESGRIHLDDDEKFTVQSKDGVNLLFVLVHEIGHALGLAHSSVDDSIMAPFYYGYVPDLKLAPDDIAGIQFLYGKPTTTIPVVTTPAPTTLAPTTPAPTTPAPTTPAPTTPAPTTPAPTTPAPTTPAPTTPAPTTPAPTTPPPTTPAPTTPPPTTPAPTTPPPTTPAPTTPAPTTPAPTTLAPATPAPSSATTTIVQPTLKPSQPKDKKAFLCNFPYKGAMSVNDITYGFHRNHVAKYSADGQLVEKTTIESMFSITAKVRAAAYNEVTDQTFLFTGRYAYRFTGHKLDAGFPVKISYWVRSAVVIDDQLIAFSFSHIHFLDPDTMKDYVDGELTIEDEYPGVPTPIKTALTYGDGFAYLLYWDKLQIHASKIIQYIPLIDFRPTDNEAYAVIKLDMYSGEIEKIACEIRSAPRVRGGRKFMSGHF